MLYNEIIIYNGLDYSYIIILINFSKKNWSELQPTSTPLNPAVLEPNMFKGGY